MKHLDLVCVAADRESTLARLRDLGVVHLDLRSVTGEGVVLAKGAAADAERAVRIILKAREGKGKEPLEIRPHPVDEVLQLESDRERLISEAEDLRRTIAKYEPYGDFDPALAKKILDAGVDISSVVELPAELPDVRLSEMKLRLARLETLIVAAVARLAGCDEKAILKQYPSLADKIAFECARELMSESGAVAFISGWMAERSVEALREVAHGEGWGLLVREPVDGEIPPTLIEPPKLFRPVKVLFDGLGIAPAYTEADVSVPFMCYFSLFFAMLVGDGAYGAIFLAATLALKKKLPKSWFVLLTVFSSATVVWGLLSNTWFGANIPWCASWPIVQWLADPSYGNMMLLCFTIGVSHLMVARIWNGVCRLPDTTALAEFGWAGILLFMYFVTNSIVGIFPLIPKSIFWIFGVALVLVFGFSVKPSELKTRGAELGMLPLNIMSALGDIISYVRLFAVGLASVKVAENFNSMATGLVAGADAVWLKALMSIAMVAILVVGHGLNLAMAGLSILVHAVRLNTLEFSNHKGVSWSGYAFSPFKKNN
jgi:V/A-type H+-transporting ATPase subunit I